jgi:hypothetical protein
LNIDTDLYLSNLTFPERGNGGGTQIPAFILKPAHPWSKLPLHPYLQNQWFPHLCPYKAVESVFKISQVKKKKKNR